MPSRFCVACDRFSFLFKAGWCSWSVLCVDHRFCPSIHLWIGMWVVSTFGSCDVCCECGIYRYSIKILLPVLFLLYPEVELLDHLVVLFLIFQGIIVQFLIVTTPFYILKTMHKFGSNLSTPSPTFVICILLDDTHSDRCEMTIFDSVLDCFWKHL